MGLFKRDRKSKEAIIEWTKELCNGHLFQDIELDVDFDVLEIGSGIGEFTFCLANYLTRGHIYACDINEKNIHLMTERMQSHDFNNITISNCREGDIQLPKKVDMAIAFLTANKVYDLRKMIGNLKDNVKDGGRIIVIDWGKGEHELAPRLADRVDVNTIKRVMMQENLRPTVKHYHDDELYILLGVKA